MELVRSAPGVCAISPRLTSVCGTGEEGFTVSGAPETSTVSWCCASASAKCISCTLPEFTVTDCCAPLNPCETTVTSYSPTGTLERSAMPSSFVVPEVLKADVRLCASTCAPCTGRCCGSCTMALMVPKTDAIAGREAHNASRVTIAINRLDILSSSETRERFRLIFSLSATGLTPRERVFQGTQNNRTKLSAKFKHSMRADRTHAGIEGLTGAAGRHFSALGCAL